MPEGPSIILAKEAMIQFTGKKIISVHGNTKIDKERLLNKKIIAFRSWGKHLLICFSEFTVRIHFMMFGSYLVNEKKDIPVRLNLTFSKGEINLYNCSLKIIEENLDEIYEWSADVMNDSWDEKEALNKLKFIPDTLICDALLDQTIFAGVGNIIKNEILYRVRIQPESKVGKIPKQKLKKVIKESRQYSFEFLEWKRNFVLRANWLVHRKKYCMNCNSILEKKQTGIKNRRSFFCAHCQVLYV